jgi:serine/threonine-protein kinase RsbW
MNRASSDKYTTHRFTLRSHRAEIEQAEQEILAALRRHGYQEATLFGIRLALEEALSNAFKHGNKGDAAKTVRLEYRIDDREVQIEVEDQGDGFDPDSVPDPTQDENMEIPCGRGLKLIQAFMSSVTIDPPGNRVRMSFVRSEST